MRYWALVGILAAGCQGQSIRTARAELMDSTGRIVGRASIVEGDEGVRIQLSAHGLPPGTHAFHIHESAACQPPGFQTAGGHFNPYGRKHGLQNPEGPHAGDLPNIEVGADGTVVVDVVAPHVTLGQGANSLFNPGGTSLMIHAGPDDGVTDPAGNAGARIACGAIHP